MAIVRVGCVEYLNARPLWHGLGSHPDLFSLHYGVPSKVSSWLHSGEVDLALVSSIEYGQRYRVVPGAAVSSNGPVASVALFSTKPVTAVRTIALDSSSRTSISLTHILCAEWFGIQPEFVTMSPDPPTMLERCDAALLIGDIALFVDHVGMGIEKYDLCDEWRGLTGMPFSLCLLDQSPRRPQSCPLAGPPRLTRRRSRCPQRHRPSPLPRRR